MNDNELIKIDNTPDSKELWQGIGGHFESLVQVLCEFIDNAISNFIANNPLSKNIVITIQDAGDKVFITIQDTGTGIKQIDACFTLGSQKAADTVFNEHGFGQKHALATANPENNDWEVMTCTEEYAKKNKYLSIKAPYKLGGMTAKICDNWPGQMSRTGTIIAFSCSRQMYNTITKGCQGNFSRFNSIANILVESLGFIYSGVISDGKTVISVITKDIFGKELSNNTVKAILPMWDKFYKPGRGKTKIDLGGGLVELEYIFGSVKEHTDTKKYYRANISTSGVELRINGRLLEYNLFSDIWNLQRHPSYNNLLVCINIKSDNRDALPKTRTSKNGMRYGDEKLVALFNWINSHMPEPPKKQSMHPDDVTERDLFEILKTAKEAHLPDPKKVETEQYVYTSIDEKMRLDLYISLNGKIIIYEGKKDSSTVIDIYQLLMYWDGCVADGLKPQEAVLLAPYHPESVIKVIAMINERYDSIGNKYNIIAKIWRDENISYPE